MQDVVLAALFEIHHELHGDPRTTRPARIGRVAAVTVEIPGISGFGHYAISKRTFCAPFHSTVLPKAGKFSRPEVKVMK